MPHEKEDLEILQERYSNLLQIDNIDCEIGWFDLIDKTLSEILMICCDTGEEVKFITIKEKFGGLRMFYKTSSEDENFLQKIDDCIYNAENESYTVCEVCGEEGKVREGNRIMTRCNDHKTIR
jgi:hypothetical protein